MDIAGTQGSLDGDGGPNGWSNFDADFLAACGSSVLLPITRHEIRDLYTEFLCTRLWGRFACRGLLDSAPFWLSRRRLCRYSRNLTTNFYSYLVGNWCLAATAKDPECRLVFFR